MDLESIISDICSLSFLLQDPGELIFLFVLWGSIIFLVLFVIIKLIKYFKRRKKEDFKVEKAILDSSEEIADENTNQITLYSFNPSMQSKLCPNCDGENKLNSEKCSICGEKLR